MIEQSLVSSASDPDIIIQLDIKISELSRQIEQDEEVVKKGESELKILNSSPSLDEASAELSTVFHFIVIVIFSFIYLFSQF